MAQELFERVDIEKKPPYMTPKSHEKEGRSPMTQSQRRRNVTGKGIALTE